MSSFAAASDTSRLRVPPATASASLVSASALWWPNELPQEQLHEGADAGHVDHSLRDHDVERGAGGGAEVEGELDQPADAGEAVESLAEDHHPHAGLDGGDLDQVVIRGEDGAEALPQQRG